MCVDTRGHRLSRTARRPSVRPPGVHAPLWPDNPTAGHSVAWPPPSVAWQGHIRPLCGLARPHQALSGHVRPLCGLARPHQAPSVAWQGHIRPLCGLARPHQASQRPDQAISGQIWPDLASGRPPEASGRPEQGKFGPDPAGAGGRKGRVWLSGGGWPRMLPARPLGPSGAHLGPSWGPWGPKWALGPPCPPLWGPPLFPLRDGRPVGLHPMPAAAQRKVWYRVIERRMLLGWRPCAM